MVSGLVDHLGRPVKSTARLKQEVSAATVAGVRSVLSGHPEVGMDPVRLAQILRAAEQGDAVAYLELAEAMEEKDLHYLSVMGTRKRAVAQLPITVEAADDSAEAEADAELIRTWLKRDALEDELFDLQDATGKGYSASEIVWETTPEAWLPKRLIRRDPRWFRFDRVDGETLRLIDDQGGEADLEPFKWVVHMNKAKSGLPIRGGLARAVAWGYLFKNFTLKDWVAFAEIYGIPFRLGRYDGGATEDDKRALLQALVQMGADAAGMVPKSTEIEFVDGKGGASDGALFKNLAEYIDKQVSKAVLGQTATTDAVASGLGGGLGQVHDGVRGDIERADAKQLAATLNQQLVQPIVMLNRGPRKAYPRLVIGREEAVDLQATIDATDKLVGMGLKVPAGWARKLIRAPEPKGDEEILAAPASPAILPPQISPQEPLDPQGAPTGRADPSKPPRTLLRPFSGASGEKVSLNAEGARDPDELEQLAADALGGWRPMMAPVVDPIRSAADAAEDLSDLRDRLSALLAEIDVRAAAEGLARATFVARLAGETATPVGDVEPEAGGTP